MRVLATLLALMVVPGLSGCGLLSALVERQAIAKAEFSFKRAEFSRMDIPFVTPDARVEFKVILGVKNPNPVAAVLDRLDYEIRLQDSPVGAGQMTDDFRVAAGGTEELVLPVSVKYDSLARPALETLQAALEAREIGLGVWGTSHLATPIGTLDFPVQVSGRSRLERLLQLPVQFGR